MGDASDRQRTVLRAPRVEFDLSALLLGAAGWLAYQWVWPVLAWALAVEPATLSGAGGATATVQPWHVLKWEFFQRLFRWSGLPFLGYVSDLVGAPPMVFAPAGKPDAKAALYSLDSLAPSVPAWKLGLAAACLLLMWSVVGGAIARVYAVRFARDESVGAGDGLAFSLSNLASFLKAPLFIAAAALLFFGLAGAAALASALPYAGPLLMLVLYPLLLVASLIVVVIAAGGVFGFPILHAALATERNGTLDAISRTFSYVYTRPVQFLVSLIVTTLVAFVIVQFGTAFLGMAAHALSVGTSWNPFGDGPDFRAAGAKAIGEGFNLGLPGNLGALPPLDGVDVFVGAWRLVAWLFTALARLAVSGFVLSYFVGGLTDTYFMLRKDVDGIDDSEVYVEGDVPADLGAPLAGQPRPGPGPAGEA